MTLSRLGKWYLALACLSFYAPAQIITTVVGRDWAFPLSPTPAVNLPLSPVGGIASDKGGNFYIADPQNAVVVKVDATGVGTVIAGNGIPGFSGDGGPAVSASMSNPVSVAVDANGNIYIADQAGARIRKVTQSGVISTFAGVGMQQHTGDGGPAAKAAIANPTGLSVDAAGNVYFCEPNLNYIRKIDVNGVITTVAGTGQQQSSGDGGLASRASVNTPVVIAFDSKGNLYFGESFGCRVREIDATGTVTTKAGTGQQGFSPDGTPATQAEIGYVLGLAFDLSGNLVFNNGAAIRMLTAQGVLATIAGGNTPFGFSGDGSPATTAVLSNPGSLAVDPAGRILVSDSGNERVRRFSEGGTITTVAGNGGYRLTPDGTAATLAYLYGPVGIAFDSAGDLFVVDEQSGLVQMVQPNGQIKRIAGGTSGGQTGNVPALDAFLGYPRYVAPRGMAPSF